MHTVALYIMHMSTYYAMHMNTHFAMNMSTRFVMHTVVLCAMPLSCHALSPLPRPPMRARRAFMPAASLCIVIF